MDSLEEGKFMTEELNEDQKLNEWMAEDEKESSEPKASEEESSKVSEEPSESSKEVPSKEEPSKEEVKAEVKPETPDEETLRLFNEARTQYGEKRIDGLMSAWQKDRTELLHLQEKNQESAQKAEKNQDDVLVEYLDKKLEERRVAREQQIQTAVRKEVDEARTIYPQYSEKQLLETANDLSSGNKPISIMTAAIHLAKIDEAVKVKGELAAEEATKKQKAGTMAGRSGFQTATGLQSYDSKIDGTKTLGELVDDSKKELGIK